MNVENHSKDLISDLKAILASDCGLSAKHREMLEGITERLEVMLAEASEKSATDHQGWQDALLDAMANMNIDLDDLIQIITWLALVTSRSCGN